MLSRKLTELSTDELQRALGVVGRRRRRPGGRGGRTLMNPITKPSKIWSPANSRGAPTGLRPINGLSSGTFSSRRSIRGTRALFARVGGKRRRAGTTRGFVPPWSVLMAIATASPVARCPRQPCQRAGAAAARRAPLGATTPRSSALASASRRSELGRTGGPSLWPVCG